MKHCWKILLSCLVISLLICTLVGIVVILNTTAAPPKEDKAKGECVPPWIDIDVVCKDNNIPEEKCNCQLQPTICNAPPPPNWKGPPPSWIDIDIVCRDNDIPKEKCNCQSQPEICSAPPPPDWERKCGTPSQNPTKRPGTLDEVCHQFNISKEHCTCKNPVLADVCPPENPIRTILKFVGEHCQKFNISKENCTCRNPEIAEACHSGISPTHGTIIISEYEYCQKFNISKENCSCKNPALADVCHAEIPQKPVEDYCQKFNISKENCSCENPALADVCYAGIPQNPFEEYCQKFNISKENCTCNNPHLTRVCKAHKPFVVDSLPELCQHLRISKESCTCENSNITNFCEFFQVKYESRCNLFGERIRASITLVSSLIGMVGNALVVIVTSINWRQSTYCHKLIGGLALSDFIFSLVQLIEIAPIFRSNNPCSWIYGHFGCKFIFGASASSGWIAIGFILIITVERFLGIVYPFSRGLSSRQIFMAVVLNILFTGGAIVPNVIAAKFIPEAERCVDDFKRSVSIYNSWFIFVFSFIIPLICLVIMYGKIIATLKRARSEMRANVSFQRRNRENKRIVIVLLLIILFYMILVLPNRLVWILIDHGYINAHTSLSEHSAWKTYGSLPYVIHVVVNPIIYSLIDNKFQATLKKLFCASCKRLSTKKYSLHAKSTTKSTSTSSLQSFHITRRN